MTRIFEQTQPSTGFCLVLSAPSGTGKTTITRKLLEEDASIVRSVSMTTRHRRPDEVDGQDYSFITASHFRRLIDQGEFIEWAEVHGDLYGTPRSPIEQAVNNGKIAILVIDVQGGQSIKMIFPNAVLLFLVPPSLESLEHRLRQRGTEDETVIRNRLAKAQHEMQYLSHYTYRVVNRDGQQQHTVETIQSIIKAERCRVSRWEDL